MQQSVHAARGAANSASRQRAAGGVAAGRIKWHSTTESHHTRLAEEYLHAHPPLGRPAATPYDPLLLLQVV